MKKKILIIVIITVCIAEFINAQKASFGITAGATLSNMYSKIDNEKDHGKTHPGFTFGILTDIPIGQKCSIQPALNFVQKGTEDEDPDFDEKMKLNINYLELPVNFIYRANSSGNHFFFGGGPAIAYAISGKLKYEWSGNKEEYDVNFGNDESDDFKPFDFGINGLVGYQLKNGLMFTLNYTHGFGNLIIGDADDGKLKNTSFGLKIGYLFGHSGK